MTVSTINEVLDRWNSGDGKPYKGSLIDWSAYNKNPDSIGCMCAQGQVLHLVGGMTHEDLNRTEQAEADKLTADLLKISRAHAVLLRNVNDKVDGAPAIVLTEPGKVLGDQWSKLLDFWWALDQFTPAQWAAAGAAAGAAAWAAARDAAWAAAWAAARAAAGASSEIQGASLMRDRGQAFYFLPFFGFATPDEIPARPADYGQPA